MRYRKFLKMIKRKFKILVNCKKWHMYNEKPLLSIGEICELIDVKVPSEYVGVKKLPIYKTELMNGLKNKEDIKAKIGQKRKFTQTQFLELEKYFKRFKRKYNSQESIGEKNSLQLLNMIIEWYYFFDNFGFDYDDYFDYEIFNKDVKDLDKFLNKGYKKVIYRACNDRNYTHYCKNKGDFNKKFKKFVQRDWIAAEECSIKEFKKFIDKHPRFFAKPIEGTGGASAKIVEYNGDLQSLYNECVQNKYICEEIVKQHKDMANFNASTLNTLRLYTLVPVDGNPIITLGNARFGRLGNDVDNFHSGGVSAVIDLETGKLTSDAINRAHVKVSNHPDSGVKFKGFQIPNFEECKKTVCEAALVVKELRHVGWDVAIAEDGHIELIEGNAFPNFDITQAADQIGKKDRYEKYIDELLKLKNK